jgi:formimidoylglutamate deiminase
MRLRFERALLPEGIVEDVTLEIAADGRLEAVRPGLAGDGPRRSGLALPGMPNLHSHAFQRAMAGSAEVQASAEGSFWGWREVMYRFVEHLRPEDVEAIAGLLYAEMLEAGYTGVAEFHYVHHAADGSRYASPARLAEAVRAAARTTAIRHLLLPTLYQQGNFDGRPLAQAQRRFHHDTGEFLELVQALAVDDDHRRSTGIALHSLRAVPADALHAVVQAVRDRPQPLPVHIHIAEQQREVADCLAATGRRPVEWLLETGRVDAGWCLVHATHVTADELAGMAQSGAVVGLCPTTEGNLGDGVFPLDAYLAEGGAFGVGSDSHVSVDPREELRAAEYNIRLLRQRRVLATDEREPHVGTALWQAAVRGGARAMAYPAAGLVVGAPADVLRIDTDRVDYAGTAPAAFIDAFLFAPRPGAIADVWVGGEHVVEKGRHRARSAIDAAYRASLSRLKAAGVA